jgi:hypothetical protein
MRFDDITVEFQDDRFVYIYDESDSNRPSIAMSADDAQAFINYIQPKIQTTTRFAL